MIPYDMQFLDLGLPSGKLWATENASLDGKAHFDFDEACKVFQDAMPTAEDFQELYDECDWKWDDERKGYTVTGTNSNSIFLPASGSRHDSGLYYVGSSGYYWSRTANGTKDARSLAFWSGRLYPQCFSYRYFGFAVRLVNIRSKE